MPVLKRTVTVPRPIDEVYDFVADFANVAEWDPGIARSEQTGGAGLEIGATYAVTAVFNGREIPMEYRVTDLEPGRRVVLAGEGATVTAVDDIRFSTSGTGTRIDYSADLRLKGLLRLTEPLLGGAFRRLIDAAMAGLAQRLAA